MGDIADWYIELALDREFQDDRFDFEDEDSRPAAKRCRRCGQENLFWVPKSGKWRLFDERGNEHCCPVDKSPIAGFLASIKSR